MAGEIVIFFNIAASNELPLSCEEHDSFLIESLYRLISTIYLYQAWNYNGGHSLLPLVWPGCPPSKVSNRLGFLFFFFQIEVPFVK